MVYDYYQEKNRKGIVGKMAAAIVVVLLILLGIAAASIYLDLVQLKEIGNYSGIHVKDVVYKLVSSAMVFFFVLILLSTTTFIIKKNLNRYLTGSGLKEKRFPNVLISFVLAVAGAFLTRDLFYLKAMQFLNSSSFGTQDPIFQKDIGYYIFQRPFFISVLDFVQVLWLFIIAYTVIYYVIGAFSHLSTGFENGTLDFRSINFKDVNIKRILKHNLVNVAIFFIIKVFSYGFAKEELLYSEFLGVKGSGYVDMNVWMKYYTIAPFVLAVIVIASLIFVLRGRFKAAGLTIAVFPALFIIMSVYSGIVQSFYVNPNVFKAESEYLKNNIAMTRKAYNLESISEYDFPAMQELTPEIIQRNLDTKNNIRIIDYNSTLVSNVQLQSNKNFYTFYDGDIINYTVNGKNTPVFITAREVDQNNLPEKSYENTKYRYTHGYGVVINPINRVTGGGQIDFILSGLRMNSVDEKIKVSEPRIYYGELTQDYVIVNAGNEMKEIDYDGSGDNKYPGYNGKGGIKLNLLNRLLLSMKYLDGKMLISGYVTPDSKILLNRQVVSRVQKALPFLYVDNDPYIVLTADGRLKWILDAYTTSSLYPYAQNYANINYIRNSVKVVVDAYDGTVESYIIDKNDPVIKTYDRIYPGIFKQESLPDDLARHMKYPEQLFKIQTEILMNYHLKPQEVSSFYSKDNLWDIAKYSQEKSSNEVSDIDPYYNMIKLPGGIGEKEELILMRPFTPSGEQKHNMVSWLSVRNSSENYGEMILFNFPQNTNIFGPNQVEVKINQIGKISEDMTLWGQSGSDVYKGSLLVIPIENSVLYVQPIYIRSSGTASSIPEVKEIVIGYQKGDQFVSGIGTDIDEAFSDLFGATAKPPPTDTDKETPGKQPGQDPGNVGEDKILDDIIDRYDEIKKQLDELGDLINSLRKQDETPADVPAEEE